GPTPRDRASPIDPAGPKPRPAGRAVGGPRDRASPIDPTGPKPRPAGRAVGGPTPRDRASPIDRERGASELDELIEAVRVGESRLFRHRSQIDALLDAVVPALRARGRRAVRVWSAGCAAGEEPYTLAMVLSRALPEHAITIIATDVSADALAVAEAATYPRAVLQHVPEAYRDQLIEDGEVVRIAPRIAAMVELERANLLDGAAPRDCDVVWCRNVLIYFTADARRRVIDRLVGATVPGGFVFVGYSESLRDIPELEGVRANDAVYYVRREPDAHRRSRPPTLPALPAALSAPVPVPVTDRRSAPVIAPDQRAAPASPPVPARPDDRTPPPTRFTAAPPAEDVVALRGHPAAAHVTAELSARFSLPGLRTLAIDLDGAELLGDELAPVLRRAGAAARTAGITLVLRATRTGARRWLTRHGLDEDIA
ncbi:MAG: CheR family methyltransferase, partial [Kofleriaceae bacterium]